MNAALGKSFLVGNILYEVESSQRNAAGEKRQDNQYVGEAVDSEEQESKKGRCWKGHGADTATMTTITIVPTHSRRWPADFWIR